MRSKNSSIKPRKSATTTPPKPARKSRTKTRKPKYLSLKLELSHKQEKPNKMTHKQQLNLFPLHPENLVQDKEPLNDDRVSDHVSFLLETATDTSTSLHGILDSTTTTTEEEEPPYVYGGKDSGDQEKMVKTAMKRKERDASEDRWVSYWELVEKKEQEEVSSCCYSGGDALEKMMRSQDGKKGLVGLKLDYQHILNAWSDKGPLFIRGESPQTVPDLHHASNGLMDGLGNLWTVPEMGNGNVNLGKNCDKEGWKLGQREVSVLRYKEKRQSRLFAKRIRYEVRKLNAEKRPRLKGRFVKRNGEE